MDVDYANNKGSYVITRVAKKMVLASSEIMTWDDYRARGRPKDLWPALAGFAGRAVGGQHGKG